MNDAPVGMFGSGVGGFAIARSIPDQLLHEQVLYTGNTANSPYGPRDIVKVRSLVPGIMDELMDRGIKLLVIACNIALAAVLHSARERYTLGRGIPVIEVVHPVARTATRVTRNGKARLIITYGTAGSRVYDDTLQAVPGVEFVSQACPRFVELAERGVATGSEMLGITEKYLTPIKAVGVDTLILGCIHYPLLVGPISYVMERDITLVTSSDETVKDAYRALAGKNLLCGPETPEPRHDFASTGDPEALSVLARRFLGPEVTTVEHATFTPGAAGILTRLLHPPSPPTSHRESI